MALQREGDGSGDLLVKRLRSGDRRAVEAVFRAYYQQLCLFAQRYLVSPALAESVVEDVFTILWARRAELQVTTTLRSYLFRATRDAAITWLRGGEAEERAAARAPAAPVLIVGEVSEERMAEVVLPDTLMALDEAVAHLPERRRLVLELRWTHRLTYWEIAEIVGASVQAVEMQLHRTLTAVRMAVGRPL